MFENAFKSLKPNKYRYRVDINNDDTNSHVLTLHISFRTFFVLILLFFLTAVLFTLSIIFFSPMKYYISGLGYVNQVEKVVQLENVVDSLQQKVNKQDKLYSVFQLVVKDDLKDIKKFDSLFFDNYPEEIENAGSESLQRTQYSATP